MRRARPRSATRETGGAAGNRQTRRDSGLRNETIICEVGMLVVVQAGTGGPQDVGVVLLLC